MLKQLYLFALPLITFSYDNIALYKHAWQLHPYPYQKLMGLASKAVDGLKTDLSAFGQQCTLSENGKYEAMLGVDLGALLGIHHITVYHRTDNMPWGPLHGYVGRFLGFSVYISNTTVKEDGVLCFKDDYFTKYTIPAVLTLNCTHHGRYVIYYNNRTSNRIPPDYSPYAYNELCEFEVYGCPSPYHFGKDCSLPCPDHCMNSSCHIDNGHCFGCKEGYHGATCEQPCQNNTYGAGCSEDCGNCLNGEQCNHVNGTCPNGCDAGYCSDRCKLECPDGLYGRNCLQTCSENCYLKTCEGRTGECLGGCVEGLKPPLCAEECDDGTFGRNCSNICGHCHLGEPCSKITGACPPECEPGYQGISCNQKCPDGLYGRKCSQTCNENCYLKTCEGRTGDCLRGCIEGLKPPLCNEECDNGTYERNCNSGCGHCLLGAACDKRTGVCPPVCDPGYDGKYCNNTNNLKSGEPYSTSDGGPSSQSPIDETVFSPLTGKLTLKGQQSQAQQAVSQSIISTTQRPGIPDLLATSTRTATSLYAANVEGKHIDDDICSKVFFAEKEKLKLEMEYIKLKMKRISSEIDLFELKKKLLTANCQSLP